MIFFRELQFPDGHELATILLFRLRLVGLAKGRDRITLLSVIFYDNAIPKACLRLFREKDFSLRRLECKQ